MLAQLAEIPDREKVFADLFQTWGSELSMRPESHYADPKPETTYGSYVLPHTATATWPSATAGPARGGRSWRKPSTSIRPNPASLT